jgi:hypothetical protein
VLVFSSLFIQFFFKGGSVCPGGCGDLYQWWQGENHVMVGTHMFGLPNVSQAGLEPASYTFFFHSFTTNFPYVEYSEFLNLKIFIIIPPF